MTASKLIRPHIDYKDSYIEAVREYHSVGRYKHFDIDKLERDFEAFVKRLQQDKSMEHRPFQEWVEPMVLPKPLPRIVGRMMKCK